MQDVLGDGTIVRRAGDAKQSAASGGGGDERSHRRPSVGDQISFTVRRATAQNCPGRGFVQQDAAFERYTVGSGLCCRGVELALETMREGETATFNVRVRHLPPDTAYPEDITISLVKIYRDVILASPAAITAGGSNDGNILVKRRTRWGAAKAEGPTAVVRAAAVSTTQTRMDAGRVVARPGCEVRVTVLGSPPELAPALPEVFVVGAGRAAEALERAVALASAGEQFELTFSPDVHRYTDDDPEAPADDVAAEAAAAHDAAPVVCLSVTVDAVSPACGEHDVASLTREERLARATAAKERGVGLYRRGRLRAALRAYEQATLLLTAPFASEVFDPASGGRPTDPNVDPWDDGSLKDERGVLMNATLLNAALAASKRGDHRACEDYCTQVLERRRGGDDCNVKALFRRGRARVALERWDEADDDLRKAERLDGSLEREVALERRRIKRGRERGDASMKAAFKKMFGAGSSCGGGPGESGGGEMYSGEVNVVAGPGMTAAAAAAEMEALDLAAAKAVAADGIVVGAFHDPSHIFQLSRMKPTPPRPGARCLLPTPVRTHRVIPVVIGPYPPDETDPRVIAEHAVNRAMRLEHEHEAGYASSGLPMELYTDAERAPVGAAFPMAGAVTTVTPDFDDIEREIEEEEEEERRRRKVSEAVARGRATQRVGVTTNPWDRDGKKAEREADEQFRREYEEARRRERDAELAAHEQKMRGKKKILGADKLDVD